MRVSVLANLCTRPLYSYRQHVCDELECFDEIRTRGKSNFKNEVLEVVFQLLVEVIIY